MLEDMQLRSYSPIRSTAYLRSVAQFAKHFHTSPDRLGPEDIRTYQLFLIFPAAGLPEHPSCKPSVPCGSSTRRPWASPGWWSISPIREPPEEAAHDSQPGGGGRAPRRPTESQASHYPGDSLWHRPPRLRTLPTPTPGHREPTHAHPGAPGQRPTRSAGDAFPPSSRPATSVLAAVSSPGNWLFPGPDLASPHHPRGRLVICRKQAGHAAGITKTWIRTSYGRASRRISSKLGSTCAVSNSS